MKVVSGERVRLHSWCFISTLINAQLYLCPYVHSLPSPVFSWCLSMCPKGLVQGAPAQCDPLVAHPRSDGSGRRIQVDNRSREIPQDPGQVEPKAREHLEDLWGWPFGSAGLGFEGAVGVIGDMSSFTCGPQGA